MSHRKMAKFKTLLVCQKICFQQETSLCTSSTCLTYLQIVEKMQWKLWKEELISQNMHYQPLFTRSSRQKMAKLKHYQCFEK